MTRRILTSLTLSSLLIATSPAAKVGDVVDLTPTLKGTVVKVNGTNHEVELFANPDNLPTGDLDIPYFYTLNGSETFVPVRIASKGFKSCEITSIKLGAGIEYIGYAAFYGCTKLTSVTETQPRTVQSIGEDAFGYTTSLKEASFPGVYTLNEWAFRYSGIESANFQNIEYLYGGAFYECKNLTTFKGGEKLKVVGNVAFCNCPKLSGMTLGPNLTSIGSQAFAFCVDLKEIVIPVAVTTIGNSAFQGLAMERIFILSPAFMNFCDASKILRNKYLKTIYCADNLITNIKNYISTGSDENKPEFLASQAQVKGMTDVVEIKQESAENNYSFNQKIEGISDFSVSNAETGKVISPKDGIYVIPEEKVSLLYRVDAINLLNYEVSVPRSSGIENPESSSISVSVKKQYFNLQGVKIDNPSSGIYIEVCNGKSRKIKI